MERNISIRRRTKSCSNPTVDYNAMCSGAVNFKTDLIGSWDWPEHGIPGKIDSTVIYRVKQYPSCENGLVGIVQIQDTTASDDLDWVLGEGFHLDSQSKKKINGYRSLVLMMLKTTRRLLHRLNECG